MNTQKALAWAKVRPGQAGAVRVACVRARSHFYKAQTPAQQAKAGLAHHYLQDCITSTPQVFLG